MTYLEHLLKTVARAHECAATHVRTVPVKEVFRGRVVWDGDVEVFALTGHPKAETCYAWGYPKDGGNWEVIAVLEIPPVSSPQTAVKAAAAAEARSQARARK